MITAGVGRAVCAGAVSTGMIGTGAVIGCGWAAAKPAALAAEMTPVSPAVPATPATVQYMIRRIARSRSAGT